MKKFFKSFLAVLYHTFSFLTKPNIWVMLSTLYMAIIFWIILFPKDNHHNYLLIFVLSAYSIIAAVISLITINERKKIEGSILCRYIIIGLTIAPAAINCALCTALLTFSQKELTDLLEHGNLSIEEYAALKIYMTFITFIGFPAILNQIKKYWKYTKTLEKRFNKIKRCSK
ncbi:hypothetical protein [Gallibacterium anatis]|uniref:Uncharacterized protein n=1 Tax=Gallibacterium anatis TaxID=750 RepID=A0AAX3XAU4_9PAST|nr:hypothetical protein [Gallibacterium anatis]KGQ68229.1 hypothetical protein IO47_05935 [Gallibacterium anatis]MDK9429123.1 hypothetical protein [Gallibacterium anatis]WAX72505.1 hypothetical protein CF557_05750 [Gallibacterium anatis]WIM78505.1 hypothetical protein QP018_06865 [Gallibacterium anatis]